MRFSMIAAAGITMVSAASVFGTTLVNSPMETALYGGSYTQNLGTGITTQLSPGASLVYDAHAVASGYSWAKATAGNRTIGDYVTPTAGGTLSDFSCALFNSSSAGNTGTINSGTVTVTFSTFDPGTLLPTGTIGGFVGSFDFGASPLAAGFYTTLDYTGLEGLGSPVVLPAGDYLITQQFTTVGTSLRQGGIVGGAATVGFSEFDATNGYFYQAGTGLTAGPAAFASAINNVYYTVGAIPVPEPTMLSILPVAGLLVARRRK